MSHLILSLAVVLLAASCLSDCQTPVHCCHGNISFVALRVPATEHMFDSE